MTLLDRIRALEKGPAKDEYEGLGVIYLRGWDAQERAAFLRWNSEADPDTRHVEGFARALIATVCKEGGELEFTEADLPTLLAIRGPIVAELGQKALRLNGLNVESEDTKSRAGG